MDSLVISSEWRDINMGTHHQAHLFTEVSEKREERKKECIGFHFMHMNFMFRSSRARPSGPVRSVPPGADKPSLAGNIRSLRLQPAQSEKDKERETDIRSFGDTDGVDWFWLIFRFFADDTALTKKTNSLTIWWVLLLLPFFSFSFLSSCFLRFCCCLWVWRKFMGMQPSSLEVLLVPALQSGEFVSIFIIHLSLKQDRQRETDCNITSTCWHFARLSLSFLCSFVQNQSLVPSSVCFVFMAGEYEELHLAVDNRIQKDSTHSLIKMNVSWVRQRERDRESNFVCIKFPLSIASHLAFVRYTVFFVP